MYIDSICQYVDSKNSIGTERLDMNNYKDVAK